MTPAMSFSQLLRQEDNPNKSVRPDKAGLPDSRDGCFDRNRDAGNPETKLTSMNGRVFRADSLEDWVGFVMRKRTREITTQSVYSIASRDLVPQAFESNRPLDITF